MRMQFTELRALIKKEESISGKFRIFSKAVKNYSKLKLGLINEKMYHKVLKQDTDLKYFIKNLKNDDKNLLDLLFKKDVKNFLIKTPMQNCLDFSKKLGAKQIGFNVLSVENPTGLWTTGKANFFMPTKKDLKNHFKIKLTSILPLKVKIEFEKIVMKSFEIKESSREIKFTVEPENINDGISELSVSTDRLWKPSYFEGKNESVVLGIRIDLIEVTYS